MSVEPIGILFLIVGVLGLMHGPVAPYALLVVATVFGAAAAFLVGAANIQPAHLMMGFVGLAVLSRRAMVTTSVRALVTPGPALWLLLLLVYGMITAYFMPRLLAGATPIIPLGSSEYDDTRSTVPLGPVSSNFTQSIYMLANLICFVAIMAAAGDRNVFRTIAKAVVALSAINALFALIDLATYWSGTQAVLDFMRNAQYTMHHEEQVAGLKRIVGAFPEASAFSRFTLGLLAFNGTLWIAGIWPRTNGLLALTSFLLVVLSTSTTGFVGLFPVAALLFTVAVARSLRPTRTVQSVLFAAMLPLIGAFAFLAVILNDTFREGVVYYVDLLVLSKADSSSGVERTAFNTIAMQNFFDSWGLGVGLGTVRTSSLPVAFLSHVGLPGTILYLLFLASAFWPRRTAPHSFHTDVRLAAIMACLALICGDTIAAPSVEQGLFFFVLAGLAAARPGSEVLLPASAAAGLAQLRLRPG
ncbi:hypothetical protein [Phreatobacter sp.]|uniref:hypothetical protein n=1 Tax=Phreatobacter sp. TaxID=1966341 RepID=UPI003F7030C1